jgi:hypothetical protein
MRDVEKRNATSQLIRVVRDTGETSFLNPLTTFLFQIIVLRIRLFR